MGVLDFLNQQKKKLLDSTELDDKVVNFYRSARKTNPQQLYQMLDRDKTTPGTQFFNTKPLERMTRDVNPVVKIGGSVLAPFAKQTQQGFRNLEEGIKYKKPKKIAIGAYQTAKTPVALMGGVTPALFAGGIGAGIRGGLAKRQGLDPIVEAGKGFQEGLNTRAVTRFTDPAIGKLVGKVAPASGLVKTQLAQRTTAGLANIGEDEIINQLEGYKTTGSEMALSFLIGTLTAGNQDLIKALGGKRQATKARSRLIKTQNDYKAGKITRENAKKVVDEVWGQIRKASDTKLVEFNEYGKKVKFIADAETARNWSYRNSQRGIETKVTNIGRQGGFFAGPSATGWNDPAVPKFSSLLDQKPRFEIDDSGAKITDGGMKVIGDALGKVRQGYNAWDNTVPLKSVLTHDALYKQYPELANYKLQIGGVSGQKGSFDPSSKTISISSDVIDPRANLNDSKSTLLHEIQHAIQQIEGFARGGSPDLGRGYFLEDGIAKLDKTRSALESFQNENVEELRKYGNAVFEYENSDYSKKALSRVDEITDQLVQMGRGSRSTPEGKALSNEQQKILNELNKNYPQKNEAVKQMDVLKNKVNESLRLVDKLRKDVSGYEGYKRLSGELEARAVQRRMDMPLDQRQSTDPYFAEMKATGTTNPDDYITRFEGGVQNSVKQDPLESLKAEARKYGSAEEFVRANNKGLSFVDAPSNARGIKSDVVLDVGERQWGSDNDAIVLSWIETNEKATGKGTEIVKQLKSYADAKNKPFYITNVSNSKFWESFPFFKKESTGYVYDPREGIQSFSRNKSELSNLRKDMQKHIGSKLNVNGENGVIKSANITDSGTPWFRVETDDGKILTPKLSDVQSQLTDIYNQAKGVQDPLESLKAEAIDRDLMVFHNLNSSGVKKADEMGGIPVPSLAITKKDIPFSDFGEISLVGNKNLATPAYTADVYSKRVPQQQFKLNSKPLSEVRKLLYEENKRLFNSTGQGRVHKALVYENSASPRALDKARDETLLKSIYLKEKHNIQIDPVYKSGMRDSVSKSGILKKYVSNKKELPEIDDPQAKKLVKSIIDEDINKLDYEKETIENFRKAYYENYFDTDGSLKFGSYRRLQDSVSESIRYPSVIDKYAVDRKIKESFDKVDSKDYSKWLQDRFSDLWGDSYFKNKSGTKKDYNLDNIMKYMTGRVKAQENFFYGAGSVRSGLAEKMNSIDDIRSKKSMLSASDSNEKIHNDLQDELYNLLDKIQKNSTYPTDDVFFAKEEIGRILASTGQKITKSRVSQKLRSIGVDTSLDKSLVDDTYNILKKLQQSPTSYFEVKPQRAVQLNEFSGAIVPKDIDEQTINILKKQGLKVERFDPDKTGDRARVVKKFDNEAFIVAPTFEQDEDGNYRVTGAIPVGAGIKALKNGNIKFDGKYSKGDVGKVQAEIDKLLGYVKQKGKGTSVLGDGRKMLKAQIESFADTDPEARQIIDRVNELEDILADVSHTRTNPKVKIKPPENVKINPDLDHLMNYPKRLAEKGYKPEQIDKIGSKEAKRILSGQNPDEVIKIAKKQIGTGPEMDKKSLKQHWKKFYSDWVNALQPIEDLRNQAIRVGGTLKNDPKVAITRFLGAGGKAELRQRQNVQPVIDELSDLGISNSDFDIFLKAQRDIELGSRVDPVYGSDPVMARKVIESLSQKYDVSKMEELANRLYTYQNKLLAETRDAGFLTQDAFDNITASNQKYVPFDRIMDDIDDFIGLPTRSLQQGSQVIQKIKGSKRKILSPLESVISNTYKMESAIAKNRVAQSIASLKNVPGFENVIREAKKSQTKGTISVWENGSKKYYQVPEDVVTAVKGLDEEQTNLVIEVLSAPARMLRQQATGRNLDFMIPNAFRDQFEASFNSKYGYRPFLDYFDGLRHWLNFKFKKSDDVVEEWINSGGSMFFENMEGRKAISQQISDAKQKRFTKKLYDWAVGGIDFIGDISEKPTRIGLYKRARKAGADTFESALESREGTLDFARRGARMKVANSIIPFLNVSVQGFDRYIRTWKSNPGASAIKTAVYAGTPALTLSLYNNLFHPEEYAEVPDFEKESNWIFLDGGVDANGDPTYLKLPKSHWQQYVSNPVDNLVTAVAGQNPQTFQQVALGVLSGMLPVVGEGNSMKEIVSRTVGGNLPQMFKPPIEALSNYSFFKGDKIDKIPDSKPPEEHYYSNTPDLYKYVGNVIQQSPLKIKNTVEGYAPLVKQAVNAIDSVDKISQGESPNINNIPIVRRFRGSRTGYDIDRPEEQKDTGDGFLSRLLKPTATTEASEGVKIAIPKDKEQFKEVYKQAQSKATGFSEKVNKIKYDPTLSKNEKEQKIQELREKTLPWAENYIKIQDQYPEQVFNMELDIYNKEGSKSTTDRASWAGSQIEKATTDEERENLISTLYDGQVLTKSVVEALNEQYDLGLTKYNYGDGFRYLSGGSGGSGSRKSKYKKLTSSNFKLPTIKIAQPKRYASRGISIGSNSGNSGGIKIGGFAPIKV